MHLRCPHCQNPIELADLPSGGEITCAGCGSSFQLDKFSTATFTAPANKRLGKFEIISTVGHGAFGTVFKAHDTELDRTVAIKVPRAGNVGPTPEDVDRFLREARAVAQLRFPSIITIHEVGLAPPSPGTPGEGPGVRVPYLVCDFVDGITLADMLTGRGFSFKESAQLLAEVADALQYAHSLGVVHRDVKPSNIMIRHPSPLRGRGAGGEGVCLADASSFDLNPVLMDFGLAKRDAGEITMTIDGQILGTPAYMSPEQARGDAHKVDGKSDVYSLGVILYQLLTNNLPFRGNKAMLLHQVLHEEPQRPRALNDKIPRDLETIALKAMAKEPGRRYGSAKEMAEDLRRWLAGEPILARPVGRAEKLARWARRNPTVAGLTTVVAMLLIAVAVGGIGFSLHEQQISRDLANALDESERNKRAAELRAAGAAVDLDLKYCEDGEIEYGLLRLARTLQTLPPHAVELRQYVEMSLFAWAQEIRPLVPPPHHEGASFSAEFSPAGVALLTHGQDGTERLWDPFTGEMRANWRSNGKHWLGFGDDGTWAITTGEDRIVRLWDVATGKARMGTAAGPKEVQMALLSPDKRRLLTGCYVAAGSFLPQYELRLWDAVTGQPITDFKENGGFFHQAAFSSDGRTIITLTNRRARQAVELWSAQTGGVLGTLNGQGDFRQVAFCPDSDTAVTVEVDSSKAPEFFEMVRWWDCKNFTQIGPSCLSLKPLVGQGQTATDFTPDLVNGPLRLDNKGVFGDATVFVKGNDHATHFGNKSGAIRADNKFYLDALGRIYDRSTGSRLEPGPFRRFHSAAARFAVDARFLITHEATNELVDLAFEKAIGRRRLPTENDSDPTSFPGMQFLQHVPARRTFAWAWQDAFTFPTFNQSADENDRWKFRVVPILQTPVDLASAKLFAEVVTCQELDDDGIPRPLNEIAWDQRRKQLAELAAEVDETKFLARVAGDRWHWLNRPVNKAVAGKRWEEATKHLNRLIAVDPSWRNYYRRGNLALGNAEKARDYLEAGRLAGGGFWHQSRLVDTAWDLLEFARGQSEENQLGLRLAEALSHAKPDDRECRFLLALGYYRTGQYAKTQTALEFWQRDSAVNIASRFGKACVTRWPDTLSFLDIEQSTPGNAWQATVLFAMTLHKAGHREQARATLQSLWTQKAWMINPMWRYDHLVKEAKSLIEGPPAPGK